MNEHTFKCRSILFWHCELVCGNAGVIGVCIESREWSHTKGHPCLIAPTGEHPALGGGRAKRHSLACLIIASTCELELRNGRYVYRNTWIHDVWINNFRLKHEFWIRLRAHCYSSGLLAGLLKPDCIALVGLCGRTGESSRCRVERHACRESRHGPAGQIDTDWQTEYRARHERIAICIIKRKRGVYIVRNPYGEALVYSRATDILGCHREGVFTGIRLALPIVP